LPSSKFAGVEFVSFPADTQSRFPAAPTFSVPPDSFRLFLKQTARPPRFAAGIACLFTSTERDLPLDVAIGQA
jgi:hypothetical protein